LSINPSLRTFYTLDSQEAYIYLLYKIISIKLDKDIDNPRAFKYNGIIPTILELQKQRRKLK
jgi:hypothetical protein